MGNVEKLLFKMIHIFQVARLHFIPPLFHSSMQYIASPHIFSCPSAGFAFPVVDQELHYCFSLGICSNCHKLVHSPTVKKIEWGLLEMCDELTDRLTDRYCLLIVWSTCKFSRKSGTKEHSGWTTAVPSVEGKALNSAKQSCFYLIISTQCLFFSCISFYFLLFRTHSLRDTFEKTF